MDESRLKAAAELLRHRGPDGSAVWSEPGLGLAHTRLAIIDRAHGDQPMFTQDGRYVVVFNGEIYNHHQLRADLERRGRVLQTQCDTEVLPHLYAADGPDMVRHLRGMFALAIFDRTARTLFLARDRFGKKPLYLAEREGALAFASSTDALLAVADLSPSVDSQALFEYLVFQYVPAPRSPFSGVAKLEPGHLAEWQDGRLSISSYWRPPRRAGRRPLSSFGPSDLERLRAAVGDSVRSRLESEVPLGIFLSGGLDSSIVVAEAARAGIRPRTFSVGFGAEGYDETHYAAMVAKRFDTEHTRLVADDDVTALLERFTAVYDEPFADSSALATLAVAKAAAQHVTVVLTGDGGDEMFGGYTRYEWVRRGARLNQRLGLAAPWVAAVAGLGGMITGRGSLKHASSLMREPWTWYRNTLMHFQPADAARLLRPEIANDIDVEGPIGRLDALWREGSGSLGDLAWIDEQTYLPDDLLTKMDRATMAFGVEARSPLLDHLLAELCADYPDEWLFARGRGKLILREAYRDLLPPAILDRPKMGFGVPIEAWLRGPLRSEVERLLLAHEAVAWEWLRRDNATRFVKSFLDGARIPGRLVWNLTAFAGWADRRLRAGATATTPSLP